MVSFLYFFSFFSEEGGGGGGDGLNVVSDFFLGFSSLLPVRVVIAAVSERGRTPVGFGMLMGIGPSCPGDVFLGGSLVVDAVVVLVGGGTVIGRVLVAVLVSGGGGM